MTASVTSAPLAITATFAVLVVVSIQTVNAIKCWDCNSMNNPPCGDTFDNYTVGLVDCDQRQDLVNHLEKQMDIQMEKATICRKTVQTVEGETRVIRGCGWLPNDPGLEDRKCFKRTGTANIQVTHCVCEGDGCNSATAATTVAAAALLFNVAAAVIPSMP